MDVSKHGASKRTAPAHTVMALEQRVQDLQGEVESLNREQTRLRLQHHVLSAWVSSLAQLQQHIAAQDGDNSPLQSHEFEQLLHEFELSLLQPAGPRRPSRGGGAGAGGHGALAFSYEAETIAAFDDPMALFRDVLSVVPEPAAATMAPEAFAQVAQEMVLNVGLHLHALQLRDTAALKEKAAQAIRRHIITYLRVAVSLVCFGRSEILEGVTVFNLDTLQQDPEGAVASAAQTAALVPRLALTPQQEAAIAAGVALFSRLLTRVMQERQALQQQQVDAEALPRPDEAGRGGVPLASLGARNAQRERVEAWAARLRRALQQEYVLRMVAAGWFFGCLTWEQLATLMVWPWPFIARISLISHEVLRAHEARCGPLAAPATQP